MTERFKRECAAAREVSSPHVIRIHDLGEARPGLLYLQMIDATTLVCRAKLRSAVIGSDRHDVDAKVDVDREQIAVGSPRRRGAAGLGGRRP